MRRNPVSRWAKTLKSSEEEINSYLEELGFQYMYRSVDDPKKTGWIITEEGQKHCKVSRIPFSKKILWDLDAYVMVMKLHGKKKGTFFHCEKCNQYLNTQKGFQLSMDKWKCENCGYLNTLKSKDQCKCNE